MTIIHVDSRFCGPPDSANGGYISGSIGTLLEGPAEVTLRRPPPLDTDMQVVRHGEDQLQLFHGEDLIAEARKHDLSLDIPQAPDYDEAVAASKLYTGFDFHAFPGCFVCGPDREAGDGMHIFPGEVKGKNMVASPWMPDASLAGKDGNIHPVFAWAALDCPGAFATVKLYGPILLGRITTHITEPIKPGEPHIVIGWKEGEEGRKLFAGTAIYTAEGKLCGAAKAIWIRPKG